MNYRQLKEKLNQFTEEQLNSTVRVQIVDEYSVYDKDRYQFEEDYVLVSDTPNPYFA